MRCNQLHSRRSTEDALMGLLLKIGLWLINSAYNLVSFVVAGVILSLWR